MATHASDDGVFSVHAVAVDGTTHIVLRGEVDLAARDALTEAFDAAADSGRRVVVDATAVSFLDSSAIGCLARAVRDGATVCVVNPQPAVRRALEISGIDKAIDISAGHHERRNHTARDDCVSPNDA
ncbi:MAG: anti-sigma factor antagonist [Acidimicrobiaceae bacterium]